MMIYRLLALLAWLFVLVLGTRYDDGECPRLMECGRILSGLSNFTLLPVGHDLQRSCSKLEEFKNCQEQHYEACNIQAIKRQCNKDKEVLSYMCRQEVVDDITRSPCFFNRAKYEEIETRVDNCNENDIERNTPKRCIKLVDRRHCVHLAVAENCGWRVGFRVLHMTMILHKFKYFDYNCYNGAFCPLDQLKCGTGTCIERELLCDGNNDCGNDRDERSCALMIRRPEVQVGRSIVCFALGHLSFSDHIHWFKVASPTAGQGGEEVNVTEMFVNQSDTLYSQYNIAENRRPRQYASSLNIRPFDVADEGTYTCRLSRNWSASYHIILPLQIEKSCTHNEFQCDDGACIAAYQECDGKKNCTDNSDENQCDVSIRGHFHQATVGQEGKLECRSLGEKTQSKHIDWYRQISRGDNQQVGDVEFMPEINALDIQMYYHVKEEIELWKQGPCLVSILTIRKLESKDAGIYTCRLSNKLSASYKLVVHPLNPDQCPDSIQCEKFASCIRNQTDFACQCNNGFHGNGQTCDDVNECQNEDGAESDICSQEANTNCVNDLGTYHCRCNSGYDRYGSSDCEDIDECEFQSSCGWDMNSVCVNSPGTFKCSCQSGYDWISSLKACRDIDECEDVRYIHNCSSKSQCVNLFGSYKCQCNQGYLNVDAFTCQDIDECVDLPCGLHPLCENLDGGYRCNCHHPGVVTVPGNETRCQVPCPNGWTGNFGTGLCIKVKNKKHNWLGFGARKACLQEEAALLQILDYGMIRLLKSLLPPYNAQKFWVKTIYKTGTYHLPNTPNKDIWLHGIKDPSVLFRIFCLKVLNTSRPERRCGYSRAYPICQKYPGHSHTGNEYSLPCGPLTRVANKTGRRGCACIGGNPELCYDPADCTEDPNAIERCPEPTCPYWECNCIDGYERDESVTDRYQCKDINECIGTNGKPAVHKCGKENICLNFFGFYMCLCYGPKYVISDNLRECQVHEKCTHCGDNTVCSLKPGRLGCSCRGGRDDQCYHQRDCVPNALMEEDCDTNHACQVGECACKPGFMKKAGPGPKYECEASP